MVTEIVKKICTFSASVFSGCCSFILCSRFLCYLYCLLTIVGTVCKTALTIVGLRRDRVCCGFILCSRFLCYLYCLLTIVGTVCKTALTIVVYRCDWDTVCKTALTIVVYRQDRDQFYISIPTNVQ